MMNGTARQTPTATEIVELLSRVNPPTNPNQTCRVLVRYKIPNWVDIVKESSPGFTIMLVPVDWTGDDGEKSLRWTYTGRIVIA